LIFVSDDAWINVSSEQLDKMLSQMSGRPSAQLTDLQQLSDNMSSFINKVSGHEGAEMPGYVCCYLKNMLYRAYYLGSCLIIGWN